MEFLRTGSRFPRLRGVLACTAAGGAAALAAACSSTPDATTPSCPNGLTRVVHDEGHVTVDTTWPAACTVHVVSGSLRVDDGVTLTIAPGARVQMQADAVLEVGHDSNKTGATLVAKGTASAPITFTRDDAAKAWGYVYVYHPAKATLEYVTMDGGGSDRVNGGYSTLQVRGDGEIPKKEVATLSHVTIRNSVGPGLWLRESATLAAASMDLTVTKCGKADGADFEPFPVVMNATASTNFPTGTFTGNTIDELLIDADDTTSGTTDVVEDVTLHERGVPYRVGYGSGPTLRFGEDKDHPTPTLTIEAGTTLKFPKGGSAASGGAIVMTITTNGKVPGTTIKAVGTADKPIVFTSAAPSKAPGDWRGIWFGSGANGNNQLEHVVVEYAGSDLLTGGFTCPSDHSNDGAIAIVGGPAQSEFLKNSIVRHSKAAGVMKGWSTDQGSDIDFTATNTFEDIGECVQTILTSKSANCPSTCK